MSQPYKVPPITEAVIEIRFGESIDKDKLAKVAKRLEESYPLRDEENIFQVEFNGANAKLNVSPFGFKASSVDQADMLQLRPNQISVSRRAPYLGWQVFEPKFFDAWEALKRVAGLLLPTRIGVRYINRIDVPGEIVLPSEYVWLFPETPNGFPAPAQMQAGHIVTSWPEQKCQITVNVSTVPSPLVGHGGLQLDMDVARTEALPGRAEELRAEVSTMRDTKNQMFEMLITDKARELFR